MKPDVKLILIAAISPLRQGSLHQHSIVQEYEGQQSKVQQVNSIVAPEMFPWK